MQAAEPPMALEAEGPREPAGGWWHRWFPEQNLTAISAYYFAIFGLAPLVGFFLGPLAFSLGMLGLWRALRYPEVRGGHHALFAVIAGFFETLINWLLVFILGMIQFLNLFDFMVIWK